MSACWEDLGFAQVSRRPVCISGNLGAESSPHQLWKYVLICAMDRHNAVKKRHMGIGIIVVIAVLHGSWEV